MALMVALGVTLPRARALNTTLVIPLALALALALAVAVAVAVAVAGAIALIVALPAVECSPIRGNSPKRFTRVKYDEERMVVYLPSILGLSFSTRCMAAEHISHVVAPTKDVVSSNCQPRCRSTPSADCVEISHHSGMCTAMRWSTQPP